MSSCLDEDLFFLRNSNHESIERKLNKGFKEKNKRTPNLTVLTTLLISIYHSRLIHTPCLHQSSVSQHLSCKISHASAAAYSAAIAACIILS